MGGVCIAWAGTREGPSEPQGEEGLVALAESLLHGCIPENPMESSLPRPASCPRASGKRQRVMSWRRAVMGIDGGGDVGGQVQGVCVIGQEESQEDCGKGRDFWETRRERTPQAAARHCPLRARKLGEGGPCLGHQQKGSADTQAASDMGESTACPEVLQRNTQWFQAAETGKRGLVCVCVVCVTEESRRQRGKARSLSRKTSPPGLT